MRALLDLSAVPEEARASRRRAWQVACGIAGVEADESAQSGGADVVVSYGSGGPGPSLPYDSAYDTARPVPDFPSWDVAMDQGAQASVDLLGLASFFLSQQEEMQAPQGRTFSVDDCASPEAYLVPWVGVLAHWITERVREVAVRGACIRPWPRHRHAVCVTSDADEIHWSWRRWVLVAVTKPWRLLGGSSYWNIPELAARLESVGMRGTFFVGFKGNEPHDVQYDSEEVQDELRALIDQGHEVGLHGSLGTARDAGSLAAQRRRLEAVLQGRVSSVRQHFLDFDRSLTWPAQAEAGFLCDSTAQVQRFNGFKHGMAHPFLTTQGSLIEVPPSTMDAYLLKGNRDEEDAWQELSLIMDRVRQVGGVLVVNWHNEWYNRRDRPAYVRLLDRLLESGWSDAHHDTVAGIAEWWRKRSRCRIRSSEGGVRITGAQGLETLSVSLVGPWVHDQIQVAGTDSWHVENDGDGLVVIMEGCGTEVSIMQD